MEHRHGDAMRCLFCILLALAMAGDGWAGQIFRGSTTGGGGGVVLVGDPAVPVNAYEAGVSGSGGVHFDIFTALASGNLSKGYTNLAAVSSTQNCKFTVHNSSGTLVATSSATTVTTTQGVYEFTFSSGLITASSNYYLGTICDGYVNRGTDDGNWSMGHQANNYTTPTNLTAPSATNASRGNPRIWVTN